MIFYFDRDCGLCERAAGWLRRASAVSTVPASLGQEELPEPVRSGIGTEAYCLRGGRFYRGHESIGAALRFGGRWAPVRLVGAALLFPPLRPVFSRVYRLVADNRAAIGARLGFGACRI
ncbi:hypothetical protein B843_08665 [Corynebacterium vitaeruminis DSM 20294]|uniref:Thiol-disulfide oxidoreductase n=1 Tax=Corynebacterium vitaeruminis DSM 20294 TaxID=1224164 RepID=W5Y9B6_9CORY|nr:hypothetical protein B843_08665 [Corynebacterium vitaeruminis DSM 20294]